MKLFTEATAKSNLEEIKKRILSGEIFIYPTDTIYGLGCDATNAKAVQKIRDLKKRGAVPFSVISPGVDWIKEHCVIKDFANEWLDKLPGPYTLVFELRPQKKLPKEVNANGKTLGVRIPNHWIAEIVKEIGKPIITTSVNRSGKRSMTDLEDTDEIFKREVDFVLYEGEKVGMPSDVVVLDGDRPQIIERNT